MKREFKFRYANEIAGTFVLLAIVVALAGTILTARYQGWFEKRFTVRLVFEAREGTYGLKEGDQVTVGSTSAGTVKEIVPTENGKLEAVLEIKERFHPLVTKDSVGRVKKKFVAAGDAYVEIETGRRDPVTDGERIKVARDRELTDRLKQTLDKFETVALPMLQETRQILERINGILTSVDTGEGLVGAAINNGEFREDGLSVIENLNSMSSSLTNTARRLNSIVQSVEQGKGLAGMIATGEGLADSTRTMADEAIATTREARRTLQEARRLVEGAQRHWLIRKHVKQEKEIEAVPTIYLREQLLQSKGSYSNSLQSARIANDSGDIAEYSYRMALCYYVGGQMETALRLADEAAMELRELDRETTWIQLLRTAVHLREQRLETAGSILSEVLDELKGWSYDRKARLFAHILSLKLCMSMDDSESAEEHAEQVRRFTENQDSTVLKALANRELFRYFNSRNCFEKAASYADRAAQLFKTMGSYGPMRESLTDAATSLALSENHREAAIRYIRAARSYAAEESGGRTARKLLDNATKEAKLGDSPELLDMVKLIKP
jgi:ABC-type transporter Mla subunit MlaD